MKQGKLTRPELHSVVRASVGAMSTKSDVQALITFLQDTFVGSYDGNGDGEMTASPTPEQKGSFDLMHLHQPDGLDTGSA